MTADERKNQRKIQCWISISLWDRMITAGYSSPTEAVNTAFEALLDNHNQDHKCDNKESQEIPVIKARLEEKDKQIEEFKLQINLLTDQMHTKDTQIEKQAFHIQSLIQENSKLNIKLLPENTEKKRWWEFWK
jgi:predicted RNase H-like nuclease (RuvC/YqgF family)